MIKANRVSRSSVLLAKMAVREGMEDRAFPVYAETPDHQVTRVHPAVACGDLDPMDP